MSLFEEQLQGNHPLGPPQPQAPGVVGAHQRCPRRGHPAACLPPAQTSASSPGSHPSQSAWLQFTQGSSNLFFCPKEEKKGKKKKTHEKLAQSLCIFCETSDQLQSSGLNAMD